MSYFQNTTGDNISLQIPHPLTNGKKYTFDDIKIESNQESKKHLLHIFAKNTLGVVHVQDYTYYITKKPSELYSDYYGGTYANLNIL